MSAMAAPIELQCPKCGAAMELEKDGPFLDHQGNPKPWWVCVNRPLCGGAHCAHPDGRPLGTPADSATKAARIRAHAAFDRLWQSRLMDRTEAYRWLRKAMNLTIAAGHIGAFSSAQCDELIRLSESKLTELQARSRRRRP